MENEVAEKSFPICDTLRHELTWSHYRSLLRVKKSKGENDA